MIDGCHVDGCHPSLDGCHPSQLLILLLHWSGALDVERRGIAKGGTEYATRAFLATRQASPANPGSSDLGNAAPLEGVFVGKLPDQDANTPWMYQGFICVLTYMDLNGGWVI